MGNSPPTHHAAHAWTKPHHGVQHYPAGHIRITQDHWATVEDYHGSATLMCWYPGCAFSPQLFNFGTVEEARREGERYVDSGGSLAPREPRALFQNRHVDRA